MTSTKFQVEKFDGSNDFNLWKVRIKNLLVQQDCAEVLVDKEKLHGSITNAILAEIEPKTHKTIQLHLVDEVL